MKFHSWHTALRAASLLAAALMLTACGGSSAPVPSSSAAAPAFSAAERKDAPASSAEETLPDTPADSEAVEEEIGGWTLETLRNMALEQHFACAVAFLGGGGSIGEILETADLSRYGYVKEIPESRYISAPDGGYELYCIVPAYGATLAVNEWVCNEDNGFVGETGQVLYRSDEADPILLFCNVSDIIPNTEIVITTLQGDVLDWNPCLSLQDGTVNIPWNLGGGVWDLTGYDKAPFEGWWTALARGSDGQPLNLNLNFEKSGCELSCNYGSGNGEPFTEFSGSWLILDGEDAGWDAPRQMLFTLYSRTAGVQNISGTYRVTRRSESELEVTHVDGDPLVPGTAPGRTLIFEPIG